MVFDLDALLPSPNNSQDKYGSDDSSDGCCRADPCDAVIARLETILSRFVSDFNGIFAIEGELLTSKYLRITTISKIVVDVWIFPGPMMTPAT